MSRASDSGDENELLRLLDADPTLLEKTDLFLGDLSKKIMADWLTPLTYAAHRGRLGMVKLLIGRGANIHATSDLGRTALHYAAEMGREKVVVYLIHSGAQPGQQDYQGYTPLICASMRGCTRVVVFLLEHMRGQGLETRNLDGCTALHEAVPWDQEEVLAHLLRHGARADTRDEGGWSALRTAVWRGHVGVATLLFDHLEPQALHNERDWKQRSLLYDAIDWRREDMVVFLLDKDLRPDTGDYDGVTALMYCASGESMQIMQKLLEHTGEEGLDARDDFGCTALHHAACPDRAENVRALLLAGADPTIVDNWGRTPRVVAAERRSFNSLAIFNWWDGELERDALLYRARALHDAYAMHQQAPTRPVPGYLQARVGAGLVLPRVEVVVGQQEGTGGEGEGQEGVQQQRHAMVEWVVGQLNAELFTEWMQGFHAPRN